MKKILVTGACGVTSRSVTRGLRRDLNETLWICGAGLFENQYAVYENIYDETVIMPHCENENYPDFVDYIIKKHQFDCALIIPEPEVLVWSRQNFKVPNLIPSSKFIEIASNKKKLALALKETNFVPVSAFFREKNIEEALSNWSIFPCWVRPCSFGTTSGKGASKCYNYQEIVAVVNKHTSFNEWQVSEYIEGKNIALSILFKNNEILSCGMYERIDYFGGHLVETGVTGNISKGKIFCDLNLLKKVGHAIEILRNLIQSNIDGFITVDLLLNDANIPKITEINVRPTAPVEAFSMSNLPIIGQWVQIILNERSRRFEYCDVNTNYILRDIDGKLLVTGHLD